MDIFNFLDLIGGLCLFLFGMNVMGQALERKAGNRLKDLLAKMTTSKIKGFLTGLIITSIIQSSSATTVMVVGFVNSGLMTLKQAINVIMGANIGTTVTAWILSLGGISGDNLFVQLLKPSSFTPILALIGIILYMFVKDSTKKDTGMILLGFATLMFGMETMSGSVSGLADVPEFRNLFILFTNPLIGVLVGAGVTGIIQSSSASVGILQALATTGQVSYAAAIPIIMGQNIGTCVTALLSSIGTNKNARRAAFVHLMFNVIGTILCITVFCIVKVTIAPAILNESATMMGIAFCHSMFNIICVAILLPISSVLEKLALTVIPEDKTQEKTTELDERLFVTPALALAQCRASLIDMSKASSATITNGMKTIFNYSNDLFSEVEKSEKETDKFEDNIDTYLVKLSSKNTLNEEESAAVSEYLKIVGDFERISDHGINIAEASKTLSSEGLSFSQEALKEMETLTKAVDEIVDLAYQAFVENSVEIALQVSPLEAVVDDLKDLLRTNHIDRVKKGECTIEAGFVWLDLLTNLERVSDHCNNIAIEIIDNVSYNNMRLHKTKRHMGDDDDYERQYKKYAEKYSV